MTPARTMDDFPDPDGPTTAVKRELRIFFVRAAASRPRPENHFESLVSNGRRPTNGAPEGSTGSVMRDRFRLRQNTKPDKQVTPAFAIGRKRIYPLGVGAFAKKPPLRSLVAARQMEQDRLQGFQCG